MSFVKIIASILILLLKPFAEELALFKKYPWLSQAESFIFLLLYSSDWIKPHSLPFLLLQSTLQYREESNDNKWLQFSISMIMYSFRLLQSSMDQPTAGVNRKTAVIKPMPIAACLPDQKVKKWTCPVCCQPITESSGATAHPSGHVYCGRCMQIDNEDKENIACPVSGQIAKTKHVRRLRL